MLTFQDTFLYRYGERVGYKMGQVVFLFRDLSDADKRKIRVLTGCEHVVKTGDIFVHPKRSKG